MNLYRLRSTRRAWCLAGLLAGALASPLLPLPAAHADPTYALSLLGNGPLVIPNDATVGGFTVGGLSGITYAGNNTYYAILDNQGSTDARFYTLRFGVGAGGVTPLAGQTAAQVATAVTTLPGFNGNNFDGEGIVLTPSNTLLIASETEPSIREFTLGGAYTGNAPAVPTLFASTGASGTTGIRGNLAFESLTLAPDGNTLWTANEQALKQDGPMTTETNGSPVRLLRYDKNGTAFAPGAQFVYNVEPIPAPAPAGSDRGLADLVALPNGNLLALERAFRPDAGNTIQIFEISLAGATDVSRLTSLVGQTYTPVKKTLLFDFATAFAPEFGGPDNIEGIGLGPTLANGDLSVVVISDNNFRGSQRTQIAALRLAAVPEPGTAILALPVGLLLLAGRLARRRL